MPGESAETSALAAILDGDYEAARQILDDFYPTELSALVAHARTLADMADDALRGKSAR